MGEGMPRVRSRGRNFGWALGQAGHLRNQAEGAWPNHAERLPLEMIAEPTGANHAERREALIPAKPWPVCTARFHERPFGACSAHVSKNQQPSAGVTNAKRKSWSGHGHLERSSWAHHHVSLAFRLLSRAEFFQDYR